MRCRMESPSDEAMRCRFAAYEVLTKDVDLTKPETYRKYFLPEEAMLLPAMVFRHLNQPEPALRALDALAEAAPAASERSLLYVSTRAGVLRQLGRDEEALDAYERTLALLGDSSPGNRFVIHLDLVQVHISLGNKAQARQHLEAAEALASHARSLQVAVLYLLKAQLLDADGDVAALDAALQGLRLSERYRMGELSEVPFGRLPDSLQKASSLALDLAVKHAPPEGLVEVLEIRRTQHLAATESGPRVLEAGQEQQAVLDSAKKKLVVLKDIRAASLEIGKPEMPLRPFSRLLQLDRELAKNLVMGEGQLNPNRLQEQIARLEQILSRNALGNGEVPGVSLASRGSWSRSVRPCGRLP